MHSDARTVTAYLKGLPAERRPALTRMRALVRSAAPDARESMQHGMPFYELEGPLFAFASQKHYLALYVAERVVLRAHRGSLGRASMGASCVRWRDPEHIDPAGVEALLVEAAKVRRATGPRRRAPRGGC
jgi:hypothetical protein